MPTRFDSNQNHALIEVDRLTNMGQSGQQSVRLGTLTETTGLECQDATLGISTHKGLRTSCHLGY